jgi:hypothetical protein
MRPDLRMKMRHLLTVRILQVQIAMTAVLILMRIVPAVTVRVTAEAIPAVQAALAVRAVLEVPAVEMIK